MMNTTRSGKRWIGLTGPLVAVVGVILTVFGILASNIYALRAWSDLRSYGILLLILGLVILLLWKGRLSGLLNGRKG